jgi:protein gp37
MARTPEHTYQVLTKRPERMLDFVRRWSDLSGEPREPQLVRGPEATRKAHPSGRGQLFAAYLEELAKASGVDGAPPPGAAWPTFDWMEGWRWYPTWPLPNVWLGVTVENQRFADERIPLLLETPAALRFLSCEPLLGPLDLRRWLGLRGVYEMEQLKPALIDWVIAGGESAGPAGRALVERCVAHDCRRLEDGVYCIAVVMDSDGNINNAIPCYACQGTGYRPKPEALAWVRSLRDQCQAAGVPFFFKQWGGPRPTSGGRLLDGRTWDEMPDHRRQQLTAQKPLDREEAAIH